MHAIITRDGFARLKAVAHSIAPDIKSSHLAEILAASLCFRTHAAFVAATADGSARCMIKGNGGSSRARELGVDYDARELLDAETIEGLIEPWRDTSIPRELKRSTIQRLIEMSIVARDTPRPDDDSFPLRDLARFISALPLEEQCEVVALMYIGRGDGGEAEDFIAADPLEQETIWDQLTSNGRATHERASYITGKVPRLPDYFQDGLAVLDDHRGYVK